jgi:hypothetical protein
VQQQARQHPKHGGQSRSSFQWLQCLVLLVRTLAECQVPHSPEGRSREPRSLALSLWWLTCP